MDREAIARRQRRRQVEEALEDERGREAALTERLGEVVVEADGRRIDEQVFERLEPQDAAVVREALETLPSADEYEQDEDDAFGFTSEGEDPDDEGAEEIARLQDEIADSRRRQLAFQRYLDALDA